MDRHGDWMQTFSGKQFWPLDPRASEVDIVDIAHSLSHQCRYGGHCDRFYSVAEHSVYVSRMVPPEHALTALLHDATEAYCVDVPRPIKRFLTNYQEIEMHIWFAIAEKFGLPRIIPEAVHAADNAVLLAEMTQIMKAPPAEWKVQGTPARVEIKCLSPNEAKARFMGEYFKIGQNQGFIMGGPA